MPDERSKLVYSTDKPVPRKESPAGNSLRGERPLAPAANQKVIVRHDRKGRGGKSVTLIEGLQIPAIRRDALLKELKSGLGTGGTVRDTSLEIQGDHCDALIAALTRLGYKPRRSG